VDPALKKVKEINFLYLERLPLQFSIYENSRSKLGQFRTVRTITSAYNLILVSRKVDCTPSHYQKN
jgi:hypothetical protein